MKNYILPPLDLLQQPDTTSTRTEADLLASAQIIQQTLAQFDIAVTIGDITEGPTITRYEFFPGPGVLIDRIPEYGNNIAAALKAERIHFIAPVPGKSAVGIEIPNRIRKKAVIREILESGQWLNNQARIPLALGQDIYGQPIIADLADMPHLLIGGLVGSGKSVCLNGIIASLLYRFPPDQLRFLMIDPTVIHLKRFNNLPHLVAPVIANPGMALVALHWVLQEIDKRFKMFARVGVLNLKAFNNRVKRDSMALETELQSNNKHQKIKRGSGGLLADPAKELVPLPVEDIIIPEKLSYLVVIINCIYDYFDADAANFETTIAKISSKARPAGIYCIMVTYQPSLNAVTERITSSFPARIAFQVASQMDSRTILDANGADKLLGKGDMFYLPSDSIKLIRAQGAFISDQEIQSVVAFIEQQGNQSNQV